MLYPYKDIQQMHLELADKCNAGCPMCPRYVSHGAELNPNLSNSDISLEQFKRWFPVDFISRLEKVYSCGNFGDPIMAKDCLEIYQYIREHNDHCGLIIHTNGSARSIKWWSELALTMNHIGRHNYCVFSVDGLADTNHLYRRGTDFNKIMDNAKAFIDAGGIAWWDFIVFRHNEHQVEEAQQLAKDMGFINFNIKKTTRWSEYDEDGLGKYYVRDINHNVTHILRQPYQEKYQNKNKDELLEIGSSVESQAIPSVRRAPIENIQLYPDNINNFPKSFSAEQFKINRDAFYKKQTPRGDLVDLESIRVPPGEYEYSEYNKETNTEISVDTRTIEISCRVQPIHRGGANALTEIFVSAEGYVFPCCFLGGEPWKSYSLDGTGRASDVFIQLLDLAGGLESISLKNYTLEDIIEKNKLFTEYIEHNFQTNQPVRSRQCSVCCGKEWNILNNGELGYEEIYKNQKLARQSASGK